MLQVQIRDETGHTERCSLSAFFRANRDGIDSTERHAVVSELRTGRPAFIGGGASPLVRIERLPVETGIRMADGTLWRPTYARKTDPDHEREGPFLTPAEMVMAEQAAQARGFSERAISAMRAEAFDAMDDARMESHQ